MRGHRDDCQYHPEIGGYSTGQVGNFIDILNYGVCRGDKVLEEYLKTYISKTSQNKIIDCCGKIITELYKSTNTVRNGEPNRSSSSASCRKPTRSNAKSVRLQKNIQREVKKRNPDMGKILNWQKRSARHVNKGLRYMNSFDVLRKKNHEETKILFNIEKVRFPCFYFNCTLLCELPIAIAIKIDCCNTT